MMKIKEFLSKYESAIEAVNQDSETAGRLVCNAVGWKVKESEDFGFYFILPMELANKFEYLPTDVFAKDFNLINLAEQAVIQKVGADKYAECLIKLIAGHISGRPTVFEVERWTFVKIATASAQQRLAAILLALQEVEE